MLTPTLEEGLRDYQIGEKLRALRLKKKMGLVELGRHTRLSPALLSKIERSKLFPTLPTLLRIAMVFSVGLDYFFGPPRRRPVVAVVRSDDRKRFPERPDDRHPAYHFECLDYPATERALSSYFVEFEQVPEEKVRRHEHPGVEMIFVLEGALVLTFEDEDHRLGRGDSVYFESGRGHGYRREGRRKCTAIVVTVP